MSLLLDQNLSRRLPALLANEFPGCEQVYLVGLAQAVDRAVWDYAAAHGLAVVSDELPNRCYQKYRQSGVLRDDGMVSTSN